MEKVHGRYQELLTQCLSQIAEDLEEQVQLGDYGDATMVRCAGPRRSRDAGFDV